MQRAYNAMNAGDGYMTTGDIEAAIRSYEYAMSLLPDEATNGEAPYWVGITLASIGDLEGAIPFLRRASAQDTRWIELTRRLPASNLLPDDPELIKRLTAAMKQ